VAEVRAVTDTHPLIFHAVGGHQLGRRARTLFNRCEKREAILYVPSSVVWECSLLSRAGKIDLRRSIQTFFEDLFSNPAYQPFDLSADQVYLADGLRFNRDPFDALIVAASQSLALPLITRDKDITDSGAVQVIW
jgi:PIN domain nuclease of toxin-antitoxin system